MLGLSSTSRQPLRLFERAPRSLSSFKSQSVEHTSKHSPSQDTHRTSKSKRIKTFVRFRPLSLQELNMTNSCINVTFPSSQTVNIGKQSFLFEKVFTQAAGQTEIFAETTKHLIDNFLDGYDSTLMAYGQTGSGKTFTMFGDHRKGLIPLAGEEIFRRLRDKFTLKCSVLQVYNETILDLLSTDDNHKKNAVTTVDVRSAEQLYKVIVRCHELKKVKATSLNDNSSRSHVILTLYLEQFLGEQVIKSRFSLVDLAGSERIDKSNPTDILETKKINLSLSCLVKTIKALIKKQQYVPFRESKLTKVLQESLTGYLSLIITCSSHSSCLNETLNSLRFGVESKRLETVSTRNVTNTNDSTVQKVLYDSLKSELENYEEKMGRIKEILQNAKKVGVESQCLTEIAHVLDTTLLKECKVFSDIRIPNFQCSEDSAHSESSEMLSVKTAEVACLQKEISNLRSLVEDYKGLVQPLAKDQKAEYLLFEKEVLMCQIEHLQNGKSGVDLESIRGKDQYVKGLEKRLDLLVQVIRKSGEEQKEKRVLKVRKIALSKN